MHAGLGEKEAFISDNNKTWLQKLFIPLLSIGIVILLCLMTNRLAEERETNFNVDEMNRHTRRRHGGCAFCGDFSTTRCSRCKTARYCSKECQKKHWVSGHKYECLESENNIVKEAKPNHDHHGTTTLVEKLEMGSTSNGSHVDDEVKLSTESNVRVKVFNVNSFHGCEVCGNPSTTTCSRCKTVKYCSVKCVIMDWKWHKDHCNVRDVGLAAIIARPHKEVGVLKSSYQEEENINSSHSLSLEFQPEGNTNFKSPVSSQDPANKVLYLEDEVTKSRNEILLLKSELNEWKERAKIAREKFQSLKRESNYQLVLLKSEKESISDAEKRAFNVIHSLHERLNHLQNAVQESNAEKRNLEQHVENLKSECAKLKNELIEKHKHNLCLTVESDKSREAAQIAIREVEAVRQELQKEREHAKRLEEKFRRDVIFADSRAVFAKAKLSDLYSKIRMSDYKVCSICLSNDKDLAFGCGHMTCRDCGSKLSKCPICREQITNHIRLFPG